MNVHTSESWTKYHLVLAYIPGDKSHYPGLASTSLGRSRVGWCEEGLRTYDRTLGRSVKRAVNLLFVTENGGHLIGVH